MKMSVKSRYREQWHSAAVFNLVLFLITAAIADIPYVSYNDGSSLGNIEAILCYESRWPGEDTRIIGWGGYAFVLPFKGSVHTHGAEMALEFRQYLRFGPNSSGFFASCYTGVGLMCLPEYYRGEYSGRVWTIGSSSGLKSGYKLAFHEIRSNGVITTFSAEPYGGVSASWFFGGYADNPLYTAGLRMVVEFSKTLWKVDSDHLTR